MTRVSKASSGIRVRPSNVRRAQRDSRHHTSVNRVSKKASKGSSRVKRVAATFR